MAGQKTQRKLRIAAVLISVLVIGLMSAYFFTAKEAQKRLPPEKIIVYHGLPADMDITAEISMGGKVSALEATDEALRLTEEQKENFYVPYNIKAQLHSDKGGYRDLSWRIERDGVQYFILADGFKRSDKISLIIDGQIVFTIPFDWSGRIELPIMLIRGMDTTACITIEESGSTLNFCHYATAGKAA